MPTWLYFGTQNPLKSLLGGLLGSLGGLLGRLGGVLEAILSRLRRSWAVLSRLGGVLGRLGHALEASWAEKGPWFPWDRSCAAPRFPPTFKDEETLLQINYLQISTDHLTKDADTQLGAFGPGADISIQRAAELRSRPRAYL